MKKIVSLILALAIATIAIPLSLSVSAAEAKTFKVGGNRGDWNANDTDYWPISLPGGTNFGLYVLGNAVDGEVTLSADLTVGHEYGFMFGITDANNDGSIAEAGDQYYLVDLKADENGFVGIERNDTNWSGWAAKTEDRVAADGETVTLTATYTNKDGVVTIVVSANGKEVLNYTDDNPFTGVAYGLASKANNQHFVNVSAPDLPGSILSYDMVADVINTKSRINYKAGSAHTDNDTTDRYGESSMEKQLENLFDNDSNEGIENMTRFAVRFTSKDATITWETEKAEVASYFIIYSGPNCGSINRSAATFHLSGSNDGSTWTEIIFAGRMHLKQNNGVYGIHLDNDTAYNHYKLDVNLDEQMIESMGIALYTDNTNNTDVTKGTLLGADQLKDVVATKEKIAMDAGTMKLTGTSNLYGDKPAGIDDYRYALFDDNTNSHTRFAIDQNSADTPVEIEWSIADTSNPLKPAYLVLTTGQNTRAWPGRIATDFKLYGAAADGDWVELTTAGALMRPFDNYSYGIELVNTGAFTSYKLVLNCKYVNPNRAFQLNDLSIYADSNETDETPNVYGYVQTKAGTEAGTKDLRVLVEAEQEYLAALGSAKLTVSFKNADGENVVTDLVTDAATTAYVTVIANGEEVTARNGYAFIGVVVTGVTSDVVTITASVDFDGTVVVLGSAKIG